VGKCFPQVNAYNACHSSVMSADGYKGARHCGAQLRALAVCVDEGYSK